MDDTVIQQPVSADVSYDADFYAWAMDQGRMLRAGHRTALDLPNLAEEIESTGRAEKRELTNRLAVLLTHLLKWAVQARPAGPELDGVNQGTAATSRTDPAGQPESAANVT